MTVYNVGDIYLEDLSGGTSDQLHIYAQTDNIADGAVTDAKLAPGGLTSTVNAIKSMMQLVEGNLCRGDDTMTPGYKNDDGTPIPSDTYVYSEMVSVSPGDRVQTFTTIDGTFARRSQRCVTAYDSYGVAVPSAFATNTYEYTVPEGIAGVVISIAAAEDYMITRNYTPTEYAAYDPYYIATDEFMGDILNSKVDKDGIAQVKTDNIVGFVPTGGTTLSDNIFTQDMLVREGQYPNIANGQLYFANNASYNSYRIKVDGGVYHFTSVRFAVLANSDGTAVGSLISDTTEIDTSAGGEYLYFSFNVTAYPPESYSVTMEVPVYRVPSNWDFETAQKVPYKRVTGELQDGGRLTIAGRSAIKDGQKIVFKGYLSSFSSVTMNFSDTVRATNYITVDSSEVTVKNNSGNPNVAQHGLTISGDLTVMVEFIRSSARITLISDGSMFTETLEWSQTGGTFTQPEIVSSGTVCSSATLESAYPCAGRKTWYFGDSYVSFGDQRWPYYLVDLGLYENLLFNGSPGLTSYGSYGSMSALVEYGTPDVAVLATGMNDGSDSETSAPTLWLTNRSAFLALCELHGITPVFCTVPTVPSVNNEKKNEWVRSSGYRYIDFAAAVGADGTGAWTAGMLSSDNVHPTAKGAKALFSQVLADLPEVFIS